MPDLCFFREGSVLRFSKFAVGLFGSVLFSLLPPISSFAAPSAPVPLDNWSYSALDKLGGLGLVDSSLAGIRPWSRREVARQVTEAREACTRQACPPVAGELLDRLEREFAAELTRGIPTVPGTFELHDNERQVKDADGTLYLSYRLTNTGGHAGSFRIAATVAGMEGNGGPAGIFADRDENGLPDRATPLPQDVDIAGGASVSFVVAVPDSIDRPSPAGRVHVTAMAAPVQGGKGGFTPLREMRLGYFYKKGSPSLFPGTDAHQFALNTNNDGIDYREHHNLQVVLESEARLGKYLLFNWRPLVEVRDGGGASLHTLQGLAALGLGPLQLSVGRQSLWWGQGRRGTLLLSNNARPLDMVRLTNPVPARLPWFLRVLGPFRFDFFVSRLEEDRVVAEPYFGGLRFDLRPFSWLELGASRTVIFGGEGRPGVGFDDLLTIVGGENVGGSSESNQIAAIDARIRIPALAGLEIYGEYGGEDQADLLDVIPFFCKKAFLLGLYLPRLEPSGRLGLRLEHADLSTINLDSSVWYRHGTYESGYVYEGNLLGHPVGGDGRETWGELRWFARPDLTLAASFAYQRRGETLAEQEKHYQPALSATWQAKEHLDLTLRYAYDRVKNVGFVDGENDEYHFGGVEVRAFW